MEEDFDFTMMMAKILMDAERKKARQMRLNKLSKGWSDELAGSTVMMSQKFWDLFPVEPANSTDHSLDGLLGRISPRLLPSGVHHNLLHHLREVKVFHLHPPLPPPHVRFTKDVALLRACM